MFAYVPARGGSKRVPRKNIADLGGKPLLGHVIDSLKELDFLSGVYVSTDDLEIAEVAAAHGAETLELRAEGLSGDKAGFGDLIRDDLPRFCKAAGESDVLFMLATAALVPSSVLRNAYEAFLTKRPEILMASEVVRQSPYWAFHPKSDGFWEPLFPEYVLVNSQNLPTALTDAGLFYLLDAEAMRQYSCHKLAKKLLPFPVDRSYSVDVDTPEDFEELRHKFQELKKDVSSHFHR